MLSSQQFPRFQLLMHSDFGTMRLDFNQFVISRDIGRTVTGSCPSSLQDTDDMPDNPYFTYIVVHTFKL
jgi:hypothetical protein